MIKVFVAIALAAGTLGAASNAFAQQGPNANPMGFDYGPFHPAVPPQETTYYPPAPSAFVPYHRPHRVRRLSY